MIDDLHPVPGIPKKSRKPWVLPWLLGGILVVSILGNGLISAGDPRPCNATGNVGTEMGMQLSQRLYKTLEGIASQKRIYWISRDASAAPEPDPNGYGQEENTGALDFLAEAEVLEGEALFFSRDITPLAGTAVQYYLDETILAITWKEAIDGGVYTFSEIKIAHPSQFRRFLAGGEFGSDKRFITTEMAQSVNAVVASSGDFYHYRRAGTLVYDGVVRRVDNGLVDTCYIDEKGDLLFSRKTDDRDTAQFQQFVNENKIQFSLAFGPILIESGQVVTPERYTYGEIDDHYPRSALCQLGQLHYLLAVVNGEEDYPETPTIHRFAQNLQQRGIQTAYALDGGQTAVIAMDGELVNSVLFGYQRNISDIIYFATAIPDENSRLEGGTDA